MICVFSGVRFVVVVWFFRDLCVLCLLCVVFVGVLCFFVFCG